MVASDLSRKIIYIEFQWIHRYTPICKLEQWFFHRFCEVCQDKELERPLGMGDKVKTKIISINLPINELKTRKFIHCDAMSWTDVELPALWVWFWFVLLTGRVCSTAATYKRKGLSIHFHTKLQTSNIIQSVLDSYDISTSGIVQIFIEF